MGESTTNTNAATAAAHAFIARWSRTTASELGTAQSFVMDLCQLLGVDKPHRNGMLAPESGNTGLTLTGL